MISPVLSTSWGLHKNPKNDNIEEDLVDFSWRHLWLAYMDHESMVLKVRSLIAKGSRLTDIMSCIGKKHPTQAANALFVIVISIYESFRLILGEDSGLSDSLPPALGALKHAFVGHLERRVPLSEEEAMRWLEKADSILSLIREEALKNE